VYLFPESAIVTFAASTTGFSAHFSRAVLPSGVPAGSSSYPDISTIPSSIFCIFSAIFCIFSAASELKP